MGFIAGVNEHGHVLYTRLLKQEVRVRLMLAPSLFQHFKGVLGCNFIYSGDSDFFITAGSDVEAVLNFDHKHVQQIDMYSKIIHLTIAQNEIIRINEDD